MRTVLASLPVLVLLGLAGCGPRLNFDQSIDLKNGGTEFRILDRTKSAQKINVAATSTGGEIDVLVFLEKAGVDPAVVMRDAKNILAKAEKTSDAKLSVDIPANEVAVVGVQASDQSKKPVVKLKITN